MTHEPARARISVVGPCDMNGKHHGQNPSMAFLAYVGVHVSITRLCVISATGVTSLLNTYMEIDNEPTAESVLPFIHSFSPSERADAVLCMKTQCRPSSLPKRSVWNTSSNLCCLVGCAWVEPHMFFVLQLETFVDPNFYRRLKLARLSRLPSYLHLACITM